VWRCCRASDLRDLADVSHSTYGDASPTLTAVTGASPCSSSPSLLPSVFTSNLPEGLALPPPASPFFTDNLEVNQRTFAKDRLTLTPSCEDGWWEAGRRLDLSLRGRCTHCARNAHRMQRQDFAQGGFLFLFPWKNEAAKTTNLLKQQKLFKKTHLPFAFFVGNIIEEKNKKTTKKKHNKKKTTQKKVALRWSWTGEARWLPGAWGALGSRPPCPETPHGIAAELIFPAAFPLPLQLARVPPPTAETSCQPRFSRGKMPRAVRSKTCAREVAEAATLCIDRGSILPVLGTWLGSAVLSMGRLGRGVRSAPPARSGGEQGDPSQQLEGLVLAVSDGEGWCVPGATSCCSLSRERRSPAELRLLRPSLAQGCWWDLRWVRAGGLPGTGGLSPGFLCVLVGGCCRLLLGAASLCVSQGWDTTALLLAQLRGGGGCRAAVAWPHSSALAGRPPPRLCATFPRSHARGHASQG